MKEIVIDIGHLNDTWEKTNSKGIKLSKSSVEEFDLNVLVGVDLYNILRNEGIETSLSIPDYLTKKSPDILSDRTKNINKINPDLSVSIHHDASDSNKTRGFTIYTWKGNNNTKNIKNNITTQLKKNCIENSLNYDGYSVCYPGHQNFALVREPHCDAILIECGFFTNQEDRELTTKYHWTIAYRIACGILGKEIPINKTNINTSGTDMIDILFSHGIITDKDYWRSKILSDKDLEYLAKELWKKIK